jgi:hypothetical protein
VVRPAVVDDAAARGLFAPADREAADRAVSLVPDADEVGRLLLVAELHGEVRGFASLVWIHHLQLTGPEAHVAELVVAGRERGRRGGPPRRGARAGRPRRRRPDRRSRVAGGQLPSRWSGS